MPVGIEIQNLKVRSLDVDFNEVTWEVADFSSNQADLLDFTFTVLRSEGPEGPYDMLAEPFEDRYLFIDNFPRPGDIYRKLFYKIRITEKSSGDTRETEPVQLQADPDLIALELRKHMNLLFREFTGRRCWVLPARTFGQRCGCFNATLSKRTRSGCRTCYDTGFVRGYLRPIEAWLQFDPSADQNQQTAVGELQTQNTTMRMGYYPPLKPRDLIVEPENLRWRVVTVTHTEILRAPVHQEVQVHRVPPGDIEYAITFDIGSALKDLFLSPARSFTNPQNLAAFQNEAMPPVFLLYPPAKP